MNLETISYRTDDPLPEPRMYAPSVERMIEIAAKYVYEVYGATHSHAIKSQQRLYCQMTDMMLDIIDAIAAEFGPDVVDHGVAERDKLEATTKNLEVLLEMHRDSGRRMQEALVEEVLDHRGEVQCLSAEVARLTSENVAAKDALERLRKVAKYEGKTAEEWWGDGHALWCVLNEAGRLVGVDGAGSDYTGDKLFAAIDALRARAEAQPKAMSRHEMKDCIWEAVCLWLPPLNRHSCCDAITAALAGKLAAKETKQANIAVGDIVVPREDAYELPCIGKCTFTLACGSGRYADAVCVSLEPFALVSREGDMLWTATVKPEYFRSVGKAPDDVLAVCMKRWNNEPKQPDAARPEPTRDKDAGWRYQVKNKGDVVWRFGGPRGNQAQMMKRGCRTWEECDDRFGTEANPLAFGYRKVEPLEALTLIAKWEAERKAAAVTSVVATPGAVEAVKAENADLRKQLAERPTGAEWMEKLREAVVNALVANGWSCTADKIAGRLNRYEPQLAAMCVWDTIVTTLTGGAK